MNITHAGKHVIVSARQETTEATASTESSLRGDLTVLRLTGEDGDRLVLSMDRDMAETVYRLAGDCLMQQDIHLCRDSEPTAAGHFISDYTAVLPPVETVCAVVLKGDCVRMTSYRLPSLCPRCRRLAL